MEEDGKDGREDIPANQTVESMRKKFGKDTAIFNIDLVVQVISEVEWQTYLDCTIDDLYINPQDASDFLTRSHARMLHGDLVGALKDINRAIEIDPENRDARMNRAELLVSLGIYNQALGEYNALESHFGSLSLEILSRKIVVLDKLQKYQECLDAARRWLSKYNDLIRSHKVDESGFLILDDHNRLNLEYIKELEKQIQDIVERVTSILNKPG